MFTPSVRAILTPFPQRVKRSFQEISCPLQTVLVDEKAAWCAGESGLFEIRGQDVLPIEIPSGMLPISCLARSEKGGILAGAKPGLLSVSSGKVEVLQGLAPGVTAVIALAERRDGTLLGATKDGVFGIHGGSVTRLGSPQGREITCIGEDGQGRPMVGTDRGLWVMVDSEWQSIALKESLGYFLERRIVAFVVDGAGQIWATDGSTLAVLTPFYHWHMIDHRDGLPFDRIKTLALGPSGEVWVGSDDGAAVLKNGRWSTLASKRWIPGNRVRAIRVGADGSAWLATDEGLGWIGSETTTLEKKTAYFENVVKTRHWRYGFVASSNLDRPGDLSSWRQEASDNDGCWTSVYLSAETFRYAVTGDPVARQTACEAFAAMRRLEEITPTPGFIARSLFRKGEKVIQSGGEWHETPDGEWLWKADTSSDEMAGHFFAYSVFHDLVANEEEKKSVGSLAARIMDHLIANDFNLTDLDGHHTTWGVYNPHLLNAPGWEDQKGLNSLELLSHMKATYHMTGDEKYQQVYLDLVHQHHLALNTINQQQPVPRGVPWDHQLAMLSYYPLLRYEDNPHLRGVYLQSLEKTWREIEREHVPFWSFIYGWATGHPIRISECVQYMREVPLDLICWNIRNSVRKDIKIRAERDYSNQLVAADPIPMSERRVSKLDKGPYRLDGGSNGMTEDEGAFYLLCYWSGRYFGFIEEAK